ncbi:unnamed protein product [Cylindrotheca closterium]|uniref:Helicase-associated domain-containing protein n=1 Tax=Cylindrotheca closterium TaxID=2856 RepID=A0AAD2FS07_9STRA|nr:unnamed protein product [Cylindrotheca closterium]
MANAQQLCNESSGFSYCDVNTTNMLEDNLLSLMRQPLPLPDRPPTIPSTEDLFGDPKLEPRPFRKEVSSVCQKQQSQDQTETDPEHKVNFIDQPILVVGTNKKNKEGSQDASSPHHRDDDVSLTSSCDHQGLTHTHVAESMARFRPYQDNKWNATFERLVSFKNQFGHCCVPHSFTDDPALARLVKRQRHQYKKCIGNDPTSTLTTSRLEQLESIGFVWQSHAAAWLEKLEELKDYKGQTGNCNVPSGYPENSALSTWVKSQRRQYKLKSSSMTMDRFRVLKSMGFVFEPRFTVLKQTQLEMKACDTNISDTCRELQQL